MVVALGGAAFAAIPDSNGTIHGCYQKNNGNLRVVESSADCRNTESSLDWEQHGGSAAYPPGNANSTRPDPPANPTGTVVETRVSLARAGRLLITASLDEETLRCSSGPEVCREQFGLYVDGVPVPKTGSRTLFVLGPGTQRQYFEVQETFLGKSPVLPPGEHIVTLSRALLSGSATFETVASVSAVAIQP